MQLQLSQQEIKDAVRAFVGSGLGINLHGKTLDIAFTAGRGATGITATLNIEQAGAASIPAADPVVIPGYSDTTDTAETSVADTQTDTKPVEQPVEEPEVDPADAAAAATDTAEAIVEDAKPVADKPKSSTSLFTKTAD